MKLLLLYWVFLIAGYITGTKMRKAGKSMGPLASLMLITVYCLCFCMGMRMGVNEQVTSNLGVIGLESLAITVFCVTGSMLAMFGLRKIFHMDRYGNLLQKQAGSGIRSEGEGPGVPAEAEEAAGSALEVNEAVSSESAASEGNASDIRSTVILLSVVIIGMIIGAFILAPRGAMFLEWFDGASNLAMVILLCILMTLVGLDMGSSGEVINNIRKAGLRVLAFPIASMIGTMVLGIAICLVFGFSLRESAAIPIGFGWYSYAPVVIANAGQQYIVASAVSFMHNVIREVSGIVLIPLAARKIGYLEAASIPGIAAMDVCIPIVGRACRPDTVIYSFAIGAIMCAVTSVGVPLIMGA